jgi:hypothetical protein
VKSVVQTSFTAVISGSGAAGACGDHRVKNFRVFAPLVTGEQMELHDCDTGQQVIAQLFSHDWGAPPRSIVIEAIAKDGRVVRVIVPNDGLDAMTVASEDQSYLDEEIVELHRHVRVAAFVGRAVLNPTASHALA